MTPITESDTAEKKISTKKTNTYTGGLDGLPDGKGLNIGYEVADRHVLKGAGERTAIRWIKKNRSFEDITYQQLTEKSNRFANVLNKIKIKKGQTVCTLLGRVPDLYFTAIGSFKSGAVFCPMFSVFGPEPIIQRLNLGKVQVLVTNLEAYHEKVEPNIGRIPELKYILITDIDQDLNEQVLSFTGQMESVTDKYEILPTSPDDQALLHFTSGTTGMPKGALHAHQAIEMHFATAKLVLDLHPGEIYWCTADPGWVTGTSYGIIAPLAHGVTCLLDEDEFDGLRWYSILAEHHVNKWYTAPTAIRRLMRMDPGVVQNYDLSQLRLILSVGEPLHADAVRWGLETFKVPVLDNWWQTETGGIMISNLPTMKIKPGSMGKPLPGITAAIAAITEDKFEIINSMDVSGQIVIRRGWPSMFRGYLNNETRYQKCFHEEWYLTGDLARIDSDGYFWFIGRADDIIKTSGHLVGPAELESVLVQHSAVAEAAVIGKPNPAIGELIKAFVVLKPGSHADEETKTQILAHCRKNLGAAIAPREIQFLESIPKTRSGKILRRLLKARELGLPEGDLSTLEK
jgi:acetyl-CoA synthetase